MPKNNNGFIKIHRQITENMLWRKPETSHLFIHLLIKAKYKSEKQVLLDGNEIEIKRGQLITGRKKLAIETGLTENEVQYSLELLKLHQQIHNETSNQYSIITLIKYDDYQLVKEFFPADSQRIPTSKEDKEIKKKNKEVTPPELFEEFKINPLWEELVKKYPDRDYRFIFNQMCQWWIAEKKRLPKSITAFTNWLNNTKPDLSLQSARLSEMSKVEDRKKQEELDKIPLPNPETLKKMREDINNFKKKGKKYEKL